MGYYMPKALLKKIYTENTQVLNLRSFSPPLTSVPDNSVTVNDADYQAYYDKNGGKTIIMAQFIPIIRTFAPVVA